MLLKLFLAMTCWAGGSGGAKDGRFGE